MTRWEGALARDDGGTVACPGSRPMNPSRADVHHWSWPSHMALRNKQGSSRFTGNCFAFTPECDGLFYAYA